MMNFSDIRNNLYDRAERYWWLSLLLGLAVQIVSTVVIVIQNKLFTIVASTALFITPILARWFQEISKDSTSKALKCRLAILYSDAFDENIPSDVSREIKSWVCDVKLKKAPFKKPYYDSGLPHGPKRLADITSESAFWTYNLANNMRLGIFLYTGVYLLSALTIVFFLFQTNLESALLINTVKLIVILISLVFTSEAILLIKQYNELYSEAKQVFVITGKMASAKSLKLSEIMQIVEGYSLLLISSPPIPGFLYRFRQSSLNKAYKKIIENE